MPAPPRLQPTDASTRRQRLAAMILTALLVLFRSLPFALFEQIRFDSDQAIFGLMAMHLSQGRALPLFLYGSGYVLAVEAWLAAPWFWIAPPGLATMSVSSVLTNIAAAVLVVHVLMRDAGVRPWHACIAAVFLALPPPGIAGDLVSVSGGNVEPFLYLVMLWLLRDRPFWFGGVLAVGFMQREFTLYAVPVLLAGDFLRRRLFTRSILRKWGLAMVTFVAVWEGLNALQPYADLLGPGTRGDLLHGFAASQVENLSTRIAVNPSTLGSRLAAFVSIHLPRLMGATGPMDHALSGRPVLGSAIAATLILAALRAWMLARRARTGRRRRGSGLETQGARRADVSLAFCWYLVAVGVLASTVYFVTHTVAQEYSRYGLLALLIPVGLTAALLVLEPLDWLRRGVMAATLCWAAISGVETARLYGLAWNSPPSPYRVLADTLVAQRVRVAYAPYWTAYVVTFMTGERVKIASTDVVRIQEYQTLAAGDPQVVEIREQPCDSAERVARWYLCRRQ